LKFAVGAGQGPLLPTQGKDPFYYLGLVKFSKVGLGQGPLLPTQGKDPFCYLGLVKKFQEPVLGKDPFWRKAL
jgi:hypothetical protein